MFYFHKYSFSLTFNCGCMLLLLIVCLFQIPRASSWTVWPSNAEFQRKHAIAREYAICMQIAGSSFQIASLCPRSNGLASRLYDLASRLHVWVADWTIWLSDCTSEIQIARLGFQIARLGCRLHDLAFRLHVWLHELVPDCNLSSVDYFKQIIILGSQLRNNYFKKFKINSENNLNK